MQVAGDGPGGYFENARQMPDGETERIAGGAVLQIADVLAQKGLFPLHQAEGPLQFGPCRQKRRGPEGKPHGPRRIAPGPAVEERLALKDPHDRIVAAHMDRPVVNEKKIGNGAQAPEGVVVFKGYRFVGHVGACHHQRFEAIPHQQVVNRRIGKHQAEPAVGGGHQGRNRAIRGLGRDDDRAFRAGQQPFLHVAQHRQPLGGCQVSGHDGKGFFVPLLPLAQTPDRLRVAGVHGQVIAADPLDRQDLPRAQELGGRGKRII